MTRNLLALFFFSTIILTSQSYVKQVFVLNEGYFDYTLNQIVEPVTVASYDPLSSTYTVIDTLNGARFASDLVIDDHFMYIAADNMLYKYDKDSYTLITSQQIDGNRKIAIWNDKILVTRGDYDNVTFQPILYNSYLQIFDKTDLSFYLEIDTISGPKWATQNLIIDNDKAYVAINNAYEWGNEKGLVGVIDLNTFSYLNEIDLGPDGKNPDNMMKNGDKIYTINNKDWSGMSISEIDLSSGSVSTMNQSSISTGCGTSCMRDGRINYQISLDTLLYEWDVLSQSTANQLNGFNKNYYDLAVDTINNLLYASSTDYFSYGNIDIYDHNNMLISSFQCGISPGTIVFDIESNITSVNDINKLEEINLNTFDISGRIISDIINSGLYISNGKVIYKSVD